MRVSSVPADGEANAAVIKLLSRELGIPKSAIAIVGGETSRHKRISLPIDEAELRRRLSR